MKTFLRITLVALAFISFSQTSFSRDVEIVTSKANAELIANDLLSPPPSTILYLKAEVISVNGGFCVRTEVGMEFFPKNLQGKLNSGQISLGDWVNVKVMIPGGGMGSNVSVILGGK